MEYEDMQESQSFEAPPLMIVTRRSDKIGELVAALAKAQLEFEPVKKDQKNPYYGSKYADLSNVISATQPSLAKNGLVILQQASVDVQHQRLTLTSTLAHSSDQWIENELTLPAVMVGKDGKARFDSQSAGAAMTYARRYAYQGLAGVAAEVDDDGNSSVGGGSKEASQAVAQQKLAELQKKGEEQKLTQINRGEYSLFYTFDNMSGKFNIFGARDLLVQNKELLLSKGKKQGNWVVVGADVLDDLKYELEQRNVPFVKREKMEAVSA